jgi:hypothetical protein
MKTAIKAAATRLRDSSFGRWCDKIGGVIDCTIPIVLVITIMTVFVLIAFGFVK